MMRRFIISTMLAGTMALPGQMAMAETDLGEMVGTIAKTLLERSGARLTFANGGPGAMVSVRWPLDRIRAHDRIALAHNPTFDA